MSLFAGFYKMVHDVILGINVILFLGITAQWIAWHLGVPSILFLLAMGLLAGPILEIVHPDQILGDLFFPLVSASVAILVFEGALNLRFVDLRKTGVAVRNLLSVGVFLTWLLCAAAAHFILGVDVSFALLLGAILTVTGPTVIAPLLRSLRLSQKLSTILRWEGIIIDPIGAILSVLVYETFFGSFSGHTILDSTLTLAGTILAGASLGFFSAYLLLQLIRYEIIPEFLQSPFTLMTLIAMFSLSNWLQQESGLLTVTVMGLVMANQNYVIIKRITEFKESLQVLLIASLFVVLSARIDIAVLTSIDIQTVFFVVVLLVVIRPVAVFCSSLGAKLKWREILFLGAIAPRGIVAAAISSLLALELAQSGYPKSETLVTIVFIVIIVSGVTSTLLAKPLAHILGLSLEEPRGLLFLGAHDWARELALLLQGRGIPVLLVDTNQYNVSKARMQHLQVVHANALEEESMLRLNLSEMGCLLALTPNDEVNSLAVLSFQDILGKNNVYQLPVSQPEEGEAKKPGAYKSLRGKQLFSKGLSSIQISELFGAGWQFRCTPLTNNFSYRDLHRHYQGAIYPLMVQQNGRISLYEVDKKPVLQANQYLISLVGPEANKGGPARH